MTVEERLESLNVKLPAAPAPIGAYVPAVRSGRLVFLAAQIPTKEGKPFVTGKLGAGLTVESVGEAVRLATVNALAALKSAVGELDKVTRVVKLTGYVASAPGFTEQPEVLNHASNLLLAAFGERGRHARAAVGVAELPRGVPVELDLVFEVEEGA
jgi:enamine deaminase RidA (YjgF/YER057c/UK114 family)